MEGIATIREDADRPAGLHRIDHEAIVDHLHLHGVRGGREGPLGRRLVAERPLEGEVARDLVPHLGRPRGDRRRRPRHRRQRRVVDRHGLSGIARTMGGLGDDQRDRVTDVAHPVDGKRPARRIGALAAVLVGDLGGTRDRPKAGGTIVRTGQHREHARHRHRPTHVDALDPCMRVRRADEAGIGLLRQGEVVDVLAAAGEEPVVLDAADRLADTKLRHRVPLNRRWRPAWPATPARALPAYRCAGRRARSAHRSPH